MGRGEEEGCTGSPRDETRRTRESRVIRTGGRARPHPGTRTRRRAPARRALAVSDGSSARSTLTPRARHRGRPRSHPARPPPGRRRLRGAAHVALDPARRSPSWRAATAATRPLPGPHHGLGQFELRAFSQNGEDGVIAEILRRCEALDGYFVEFGAQQGVENNCAALADLLGWRGLFIEGGERDHAVLERKYRPNDRVATHCALVTPENVERLFADAGVPPEPELLSIDVDGEDYWIWEAIEAYRPRRRGRSSTTAASSRAAASSSRAARGRGAAPRSSGRRWPRSSRSGSARATGSCTPT